MEFEFLKLEMLVYKLLFTPVLTYYILSFHCASLQYPLIIYVDDNHNKSSINRANINGGINLFYFWKIFITLISKFA